MKKTAIFTAMAMFACIAQAQIPYVYDKEYSGKEYKMAPVISPEELPLIEKLPDPFRFQDGKRSTDFKDWERHRYEIMQLFQQYEIGMRPNTPLKEISAEIGEPAAPQGGGGFGGFGGGFGGF